MPLYEYSCMHCKSAFKAFKSVSERDLGRCPDCGNIGRKKISLPTLDKASLPSYDFSSYKVPLGRTPTSKEDLKRLTKAADPYNHKYGAGEGAVQH